MFGLQFHFELGKDCRSSNILWGVIIASFLKVVILVPFFSHGWWCQYLHEWLGWFANGGGWNNDSRTQKVSLGWNTNFLKISTFFFFVFQYFVWKSWHSFVWTSDYFLSTITTSFILWSLLFCWSLPFVLLV